MNFRVGLVVPVYLTNYIGTTIKYLKETTKEDETVICIVNDGMANVKEYLDTLELPENMYVLNLPSNLCFSGSNNAGFRSLLEKYPSLEYLGSLNDDTILKENWLNALVDTLDNHKEVAAAVPKLREVGPNGEDIPVGAIFTYGQGSNMIWKVNDVDVDTYVNLFSGCCFLCRKEPFIQVGFLDEGYRNGAEDMDLCLKFITSGYKLMVSAKSYIRHLGAGSRNTRADISRDIMNSISLLHRKWGSDLRKYNNYL